MTLKIMLDIINIKMFTYLISKKQNIQDLKTIGIGGNIIGVRFSAIHGDLFTELLMEKTKGPAGSNRSGFGTNK